VFQLPLSASKGPLREHLVGWYEAEQYDGSVWLDLSGSDNHVTAGMTKGYIDKAVGCLNGRDVLHGGPDAGMRFPQVLDMFSRYTLFHVAR
jgi:hypothetical protein